MKPTPNPLNQSHIDHLLSQGFSIDHIKSFATDGIIESLTPEQSYRAGFGVAIDNIPATGGLKFNLTPAYSQLMLDDRNVIFDKQKQRYVKYLSVAGAIDLTCAYLPADCEAVTEGMKDSLAFSYLGGIPTGALLGLSHATKALPKNCGLTIIADFDAWHNLGVFKDLIRAGIHCNGRVAIVPQIENEPKAGGVEYFQAGYLPSDYQQLLAEASTPLELYELWLEQIPTISSPAIAAKYAVQSARLLGEIYGYALAGTVAEVGKMLASVKFCEWGLKLANVLRDSANTQSSLKNQIKSDAEADDRCGVDVAIELVRERALLFHSPAPDTREYASIPSATGVMTTHLIASTEFKSFVQGEYYRHSGRGLTKDNQNTVLATLHAIAAHDAPEYPISDQRIVFQDGKHYLYLADEAQTVIEYSSTGWNICENSPVKFVFDRYKAPLPIPQRTGQIEKLWDLIRIANDADRLMVMAVLVKGLVPAGDDPILAFAGYAGSTKTTAAKYTRSLIDPFLKGSVLARIPEADHLAIHSKKRRIVAIDNISHISSRESDLFCNVSTKAGLSKRELHSDDGEIILDLGNIMILTSIGNVVTKTDLLDRSINIDMPKLTSSERLSTSYLAREFTRCHGEMLGGLLNITVAALHHIETTDCPKYTRLTEFAHLGEGIERYMFDTESIFEDRMAAGVEIANDIAIDASPVASTIKEWLGNRIDPWEGTIADLLGVLKNHAKKSELAATLPKTANTLGSELKRMESALLQSGIVIEDYRESRSNDPAQTKKKRIYISEKCISSIPIEKHSVSCSTRSPHPQEVEVETIPINNSSRVEQNENRSPHVRLSDINEKSNNQLETLPINDSSRGEHRGEHRGERVEHRGESHPKSLKLDPNNEYRYTNDL
jgi:hypothetical protein